jgi:type I restriction enzyme S subunit
MTALVTKHLPLVAGAPDGIKKLRTLILELAVRGKLVPQSTTDEPADALLVRARAASSRIAKKHKASTPVPGNVPFGLPTGWAWSRFNDLIAPDFPIAYGVLVPGPEKTDGVPFVRIGDLDLLAPNALPEKRISHEVDAQFARTRLRGGRS